MPFLALLTRDAGVERAVRLAVGERHVVARAGAWDRLRYLVRERPTTCVLLDEASLPAVSGTAGAVSELRKLFPSLALVLIARPDTDPFDLLCLGRAGIDHLVLVRLDDLERDVRETVARSLRYGTEALVARATSSYLPARLVRAVRLALEGAQRQWTTEMLARRMGLSRPHLSVLLKAAGLPSAGHLLVWARLLHGGRWLSDPGRSAESVARQLDYSSGAAFRRALRRYVGLTPTEVVERGGISVMLSRFLDRCGFGDRREDRSVA
ncbi:MAG: AraC family transcriptional regulator [Gemmatimonadota bacterium]